MMKRFVLIFLISVSFFVLNINFAKAQESSFLYLLFQENSTTMTITERSVEDSVILNNFHFDLAPQKKRSDPLDFREKKAEKKYKVPISTLDTLHIKDYNWLKKSYAEYFQKVQEQARKREPIQIFDLNEKFKKIFIVQTDSSKKQAIIIPVEYTNIIQ